MTPSLPLPVIYKRNINFSSSHTKLLLTNKGIEALSFEPSTDETDTGSMIDITALGQHAKLCLMTILMGKLMKFTKNCSPQAIQAVKDPKAQIFINPDNPNVYRTTPQTGDEAWVVKFTSKSITRA